MRVVRWTGLKAWLFLILVLLGIILFLVFLLGFALLVLPFALILLVWFYLYRRKTKKKKEYLDVKFRVKK